MTTAHLGQQVKAIHPSYAHIPDHILGKAMQARYPGIYDHFTDLDAGTIPETPKTLKIQLDQLAQGLRRVVFIARGSGAKVNPAGYGAKRLTLPSGEFIYDPKTIAPKEILQAVQNHTLNEILGSASQGYGAPPKEELANPVKAVVARDPQGNTANSALTDPQHEPQAIKAAQQVTPKGGSVSVESPAKEIANRLKKRKGDRWPKPGPPSTSPAA